MGLSISTIRNPAQFEQVIAQEYRRWGDTGKMTGFKPMA